MERKNSELADYLKSVLKERALSIRAFAVYSKTTHTTLSRLLAGGTPDHETLHKLAEYLKVSVRDLYRMAGLIPPEDDEKRARITSVIDDLYGKLPPGDQAEVLDIIRMKLSRNRQS